MVAAFELISKPNGGTTNHLEIEDEVKGAQQLQDFFTELILKKIGEMNGGQDKANALLEGYKKIRASYR